ncbi:DUF262 domain-containing protein [Mesomycoplasma ovipneumoniae]|uniref:DUF262 domain-containing protein n=1 Tax=Mesomycoplasma ovipneumoniae TaxID=29562 RepID=A0AAJ2UES1_9BACT|nr:DUF262 domain-containing protein [Mesomycoplasma ovipneumoniae]MDW2906527.1 DUF262 domain-containing protein [Mesomycoplasma ovipneumoniae]MDW2914466.1 DUF262 domain-containing protein [Mesomycoplasma ovipneumoniae]
MAKKKANENGNIAKNNNLKPWKIGTSIFIYIKPFIEDLGPIINKKHLDYKVEDNKKIVPCTQFAHKKITTKNWQRQKHIAKSTFWQRVVILESLKIVSINKKNDPPLIRLKITKDLVHFYKQNRDEWDGNSTFRHDHIKNIALDLFEKFISSFKKANKVIDKKLNSICFNLLLSFDALYLNSKYKEILVKNSSKNDSVIKGAIESFGSLWIPIMKDIKGEKERNILISKIENYLQKTIEILENGEINNSQNLVVNNKIKNNESKFIKTEDLEIKDEKLNKNNSEVLDMKDEFEVVDPKDEDEHEDEDEDVNEDDEPIKSKTSINKSWINEIMKVEIKEDYKKNDNNINVAIEKSKNVSSETITVQEYLQKFHEYKIYLPFFQRNYTWDPGLIENFFDLIFKEFDTKEDFLFLNTIIFAEKKASVGFWIVDGQQRTVSILLILISILKMASHFGENIFLEQPSIYQTISKILENFSKNNSQYTPLLNFFKNNEKMDDTIFSRNIQKNIEKLLEIKTNKNSVDWINDFTNFILKKILLTLIRISEIKDKQFAKLFISINVQSKPIDVVDLIASRVNEESQQEQIPYVKLIKEYFYYGGKKENKDKLGAFLQNQQYFIKNEFNTQNIENNLFSLYQQLDNLLNKWTNNMALTKETLEAFVKKILVFEYAYVGHINVLPSQKDINDDGIKVLIQEFKNTIHRNELAFINLQINMISKKGANNPYSLIIESAIDKFRIFNHNLNLTEEKENLELFSSVLFQIEKSKIIYYSNFRGQSLRKRIYTTMSQQKNNPSFLKNDNQLYHKLVESLTNESDEANFDDFRNYIDKEGKNDKNLKKNVILRVRISLRNNGEIHPKYKKHFETEFTSQLTNLYNNTYDPISVDHFFPQNPRKDYNIGFLINNDKSYEEKYNKIVQKIGNLILLHKDTNSRKQNKNSEPICQNVQDVLIKGVTDKNGNSKLESLCPKDDSKGFYYKIDPADRNPNKLEKYKEDFKKLEKLINKRTKQIFEIYFEIFFNKNRKN